MYCLHGFKIRRQIYNKGVSYLGIFIRHQWIKQMEGDGESFLQHKVRH